MHRSALTVAVVALVVAAGAAAGITAGATAPLADAGDASPALQDDNATDNATDAGDNATNATGNATAGNATANVTFENQTANGSAVVVENATLPEGGFVVVHLATPENQSVNASGNETVDVALTRNLTAGAVVGNSTYLDAGTHENVTVTLDEPVTDDQYLIAMLHQDTNDNQTYDFPDADGPYTTDGEPVTDQGYVTVEENATGGNATANATDNATGNATDDGNATADA